MQIKNYIDAAFYLYIYMYVYQGLARGAGATTHFIPIIIITFIEIKSGKEQN